MRGPERISAEAPRLGNLQTDKSQVFAVPGEVQLRLLRHDVIPNPFAQGGQEGVCDMIAKKFEDS
jgi:hypothetical protein